MNYIPLPLLNITFKPLINNNYAKYLYNSKDNLNEKIKELEKSIIYNQNEEFIFTLYNNKTIIDYPIGIDQFNIYLLRNKIKISEIKKIR